MGKLVGVTGQEPIGGYSPTSVNLIVSTDRNLGLETLLSKTCEGYQKQFFTFKTSKVRQTKSFFWVLISKLTVDYDLIKGQDKSLLKDRIANSEAGCQHL